MTREYPDNVDQYDAQIRTQVKTFAVLVFLGHGKTETHQFGEDINAAIDYAEQARRQMRRCLLHGYTAEGRATLISRRTYDQWKRHA